MTNEAAINHFFQVIADAQAEALRLKHFYARISLLTILDALSRAASPTRSGNRARFIALIDKHAQWELSYYYSLRQLHLRLGEFRANSPTPEIEGLRTEVEARISMFPSPGTLVFANDVDPSATELQPFLTAEVAQYIEAVRYPCLLWALRNSVVHELRNPGRGIDFELGKPSPYYYTLTNEDTRVKTWELFIPNELLASLLTNASMDLKNHFLGIDGNPWEAFPYREKWYS